LPTTNYGFSYPEDAVAGESFILLDKEAKTAAIRKYNGHIWEDMYGSSYTHKWTLRDGAYGETKTEIADARVLYVDASVINTKKVFDIEVSFKK
jgi:hypothetical protein